MKKCYICGEERPDDKVDVLSTDVSTEWRWKPGTMVQNIPFCIDKDECKSSVITFRLFKHD